MRASVLLSSLLVAIGCCAGVVRSQADADEVYFFDDSSNTFNYGAVADTALPAKAANDAANADIASSIRFDDGGAFRVNDACTDSQRRWNGVCTPASRCPSVLDDYKRVGQKPTVCSYEANELIVCCPQAKQEPLPRPPKLRPPPTAIRDRLLAGGVGNRPNRNPAVRSNARISEQKCEEYSRLATHTATFTLLSAITQVDSVTIPTCAYPTGLIVGGVVTKVGEFPHMAVIGWSDAESAGGVNWNCGGSLISERYVLTAGHCATVRGVEPDVVRLGEQNLVRSDDKAQPIDFGVAAVVAHPQYRTSSHYFDIAVIRLDRPVQFGKFIRPACLWQNGEVNSTRAVATGWGRVEFSGRSSDDLLKVPLDLVDMARCATMYRPMKRLRAGLNATAQLCAGFAAGGRDTCQGDSGGPLQVLTPRNQCIFHIIGVTSFGRSCAGRNSAGVYTRVSAYLDWLESVVWQ